jgi:hypothetical protein
LIAISLLLPTVLYGYFLTNTEGRSVGYLKGAMVVVLSNVLFGIALLIFATLVAGVLSVVGA